MHFIAEGHIWMVIDGVDPCTSRGANGLQGHVGKPEAVGTG
jgi:hypothetical protein